MTRFPLYPYFGLRHPVTRRNDPRTGDGTAWQPRVDVAKSASGFVITAEIPGVSLEDVKVGVEHDLLKISGEKKSVTETPEGARRSHTERLYGRFERTFRLPETVDTGRISATYRDGVLTVTAPGTPEVRPREISIGVAS